MFDEIKYTTTKSTNPELTLNAYQRNTRTTANYGSGNVINYPILGLVGEAGEIANKYKKVLRDDGGILTPEKRDGLLDELGDVLWYCAALANDLGSTLEGVATGNLAKLAKRHANNTIKGSGDNR